VAISSARYVDLYDYARAAEQIDYDLMGQADRLISRLSYFEATCRESGYQVGSDGLGSALRSYATHALPIDQRVRTVGEAFQQADGQAEMFLGRLARLSIGSVLFRLIRPGRGLAVTDGPAPGRPTPTPVPKPMPTPAPPVKLYDGLKGKPNWLAERVGRLREWIGGWFGRDAPPATGSGKITNSVIIENIQKPNPPPPKMARAEDVPLTIIREVKVERGWTKEEIAQNFTPYYRGSSNFQKSNCVWYAATALAAYTQGRIDLHAVHDDDRMSDAYHWTTEAEEAMKNETHPLHGFVSGVNKIPAPGTVITFAPNKGGAGSVGHVAWVEEAELVTGEDGKKYWKLVISEENYGGGHWKGAERVVTGDDSVKRWRRTITYPADGADESVAITDGIEFIHWDPEYKPNKAI